MFIKKVRYIPTQRDYVNMEVVVKVLGPLGPITFRKVTGYKPAPFEVPVNRPGDYVVIRLFDANQPGEIIVEGNINSVSKKHKGGYGGKWITFDIPAILVF